jgi:hypothetical protein
MRKKQLLPFLLYLCCALILSSCAKTDLPWRSGHLVVQLYRQYKSELSLAYTDFSADTLVDEQHGYERAFFDNYRHDIIFIREGKLEYLKNRHTLNTASDGTTGYIEQVILSPKYQIGIEILDIKRSDMVNSSFYGEKTRIINLNTLESVIVDGVMFAHAFIVNDYLYNLVFDYDVGEFLDMINLTTMEHTRIDTTENNITFLYQIGDAAYAQVAAKKTAFLLDGNKMIEQKHMYDEKLPVLDDAMEYIDDIAPVNAKDHWYIESLQDTAEASEVHVLRMHPNGTHTSSTLPLKRTDTIQVIDAANYGPDHVALCYLTKNPQTEEFRTYIAIYDLNGKQIAELDITEVDETHDGRFMYLNYVE